MHLNTLEGKPYLLYTFHIHNCIAQLVGVRGQSNAMRSIQRRYTADPTLSKARPWWLRCYYDPKGVLLGQSAEKQITIILRDRAKEESCLPVLWHRHIIASKTEEILYHFSFTSLSIYTIFLLISLKAFHMTLTPTLLHCCFGFSSSDLLIWGLNIEHEKIQASTNILYFEADTVACEC